LGSGAGDQRQYARTLAVSGCSTLQFTFFADVPVAFAKYYRYRPLSVAFRALTIVSEIAMLVGWHWVEKSVEKRADNVIFQLICN
jgi:hypothetical protein